MHPAAFQELQQRIRESQKRLQKLIDADWKASVIKYPEVLDYFYQQIDVQIPRSTGTTVIGNDDYTSMGIPTSGSRREKKSHRREREVTVPPLPPPPQAQRPRYRRRGSDAYFSVTQAANMGAPLVPMPPANPQPYPGHLPPGPPTWGFPGM